MSSPRARSPLTRRRTALGLAFFLVGCGPAVTFQDSLPAARSKATAWASDVQLIQASGNGVESDGRAHPPSGAWSYGYFSPSLARTAVVQVFGSIVSLVDFSVAGAELAAVQSDALSLSRWPLDSDSPRWYSDAGWATPRDVADSNINQLRLRVFHCTSGSCAIDEGAVIASNTDRANGLVQVELYPTYRVLSNTGSTTDGGVRDGGGGDMKSCNPASGALDCGGPSCTVERVCGTPVACAQDSDCVPFGILGACDAVYHQCWQTCTSDAQCNQALKLKCSPDFNCRS